MIAQKKEENGIALTKALKCEGCDFICIRLKNFFFLNTLATDVTIPLLHFLKAAPE